MVNLYVKFTLHTMFEINIRESPHKVSGFFGSRGDFL